MFGNRKSVLEMSADDAGAGGGTVAYAGFWRRFCALLIDCVGLTAATIVIAIPLIMLMDGTGATIAYVISLLAQILYWPVMESSARQATFGKVLMGIKVTDAEGRRTGFGKAFFRNLAKLLSSLIMGIGFLMAAFTSRKQALHDMVVSCVVVREGPSYFLKAVIVMVIVVVVVGGGGGYYLFGVLLPQQVGKVQETMMQHDKVSKELPKSAPSPKPAIKAEEKSAPSPAQDASAPAGGGDYDKLLATPLSGINVRSSARTGPAIVHIDTQFTDSFWLKVLLPPLPDLDRGRVSVTIGQVLDAKGEDHYDRDSPFERDTFRNVSLSETRKGDLRHFSGQRSVRVKKGTAQLDVQKVAGVLQLELPLGVVKTAAGSADVGKELSVGPVKATLKSFEGSNVSFVVVGEQKNFLGATGFDAQGVVVPRLSTVSSNDLYTIGFRAPVARIELAAASGLLKREYPFTVTRDGEAGAAVSAPAAAPEKPAAVAVAPPVPAKSAVVEVKPAPPAMTVKPAPVVAPVVAEKPVAPRRAAARKPVAPAAVAAAPVMAVAGTMLPAPKYNDVMTAVMNRDLAGATEALDFGIWVDREATGGLTPLMVAADYGDAAMVQLLLKYGADPNRSGSGGSALDHARRSGNARTIDLLQKAGAR